LPLFRFAKRRGQSREWKREKQKSRGGEFKRGLQAPPQAGFAASGLLKKDNTIHELHEVTRIIVQFAFKYDLGFSW
jgi:hypothetical protein